jgi:hypothetical protein
MAPKHEQLDLDFFTTNGKEEREGNAKKEFASLNERLEKECIIAIKKDIAKKPVQRLKKD